MNSEPENKMNERSDAGRRAWDKPGVTAIKPTNVWTKPVLERLSLREAANNAIAINVKDTNTNS
jgi:hypothetical protein